MTWAISRNPLRPGALVTAGDVCHLHPDRAAAERCGALMGGAPDLVRLENHTPRVYRVQPGAVVPFGRGRGRATETGAPADTATSEAPRRRSELAGERPHQRPCGGARRLGAADWGRSMTATWADVERAVSGRPGRTPPGSRRGDHGSQGTWPDSTPRPCRCSRGQVAKGGGALEARPVR